ncbi:TraB/GumN family protein [Lysobacter sp. H21R4]|uniref:TraB/GumN family protein n=1 Tax=Lysobacter sp. H21R4 TaxID=2781021 RepID=UPI001887B3B1|nr:TraB/GumN family protein [Lysobacter sp. H21R4]QOY61947.1 TraB/GumN family protein [Lysobacter sp. H21R4]
MQDKTMRKTRVLIASLVLLCGTALAVVAPDRWTASDHADTTQAALAQAESPPHVPPVPLLWKVSDRNNAVYLLGSIHLLKEDDYPLSADVDAAFDDAAQVVFEVSPEELGSPEASLRFRQAAKLPDGRTLSDLISPRLREKLHRLLARQGGSLDQVNRYSPWFVNLSLMLGLSHSLGFSPELGVDQHLMQRALEAGKPTAGLETIDDQLRALADSPMAEQIIGLEDFLDRPQEMPGELADLHQAWRAGDVPGLEAIALSEMMVRTPRTYQMVNVDRNRAWLPLLREMLDGSGRDNVLVVVGAMHLLGNDGLVALLEHAGYTVERICSACGPGDQAFPERAAPESAAEPVSLPIGR